MEAQHAIPPHFLGELVDGSEAITAAAIKFAQDPTLPNYYRLAERTQAYSHGVQRAGRMLMEREQEANGTASAGVPGAIG